MSEDWKTTKGEACIKFAHRNPGDQNAQDPVITGVGELVVEPPETTDLSTVAIKKLHEPGDCSAAGNCVVALDAKEKMRARTQG